MAETLAVDLGGTHMRAAIVTDDGVVALRRTQPTPRQDRCPDALLVLVGDVLETRPVSAAVIGVPGRIDHAAGALEYAPNLPPHWPEALREDLLSDDLGVAVSLANDADLATVGEARFGAGRGAGDVVYVTVSTGIGAGVLLGGRLVRGRRSAAELGHTIVDLTAHGHGEMATAEDRGSGTAFGRLGAARGLPASGAQLAALVEAGDDAAREVWEQVAGVVAVTVANVAHLFAPEVVVLGGGMGRDPQLLAPVRRALEQDGPQGLAAAVEVRTAELGDDAGLVGAAGWAAASPPAPAPTTGRAAAATPPASPRAAPAGAAGTERAPLPSRGSLQRIVLVRHAETAWSLTGQHTGSTDLPLTDAGRRKVALAGARLTGQRFTRVLTSPLQRAAETCAITGFDGRAEVHEALREWDYGEYEGRTTPQIREQDPGWELYRDGAPGGESPEAVRSRVDALIQELLALCREGGDALLFSHGHLLRALAARWLGEPVALGRHLGLGTGSLSTLGWKRELTVIEVWNDRAHLEDV